MATKKAKVKTTKNAEKAKKTIAKVAEVNAAEKAQKVKEQELPTPACDKAQTEAQFQTEVGNFLALALEKTRTAEDYTKAVDIMAKTVAEYTKSKGINRNLGKVVDAYLQAVGGTTGIPSSHIEIVPKLASIFSVECSVEKATPETPQRFKFHGSQFNCQLFEAVIRFVLVVYDKMSRKYIDSLMCTTAEKREHRKLYTYQFVDDTIRVVADGLELSKEFVEEAKRKVDDAKPQPKPKREKKSKPAQTVAPDGLEDEPKDPFTEQELFPEEEPEVQVVEETEATEETVVEVDEDLE